MIKKLQQTLEVNRDKYIEWLKDLISINTEVIGHGIKGGREGKGQEYIENLLKSLGATTERDQLDEERILQGVSCYQEGNLGHDYTDRFNVYGSFQGIEDGKALLFNGHIDTMPPGDLKKWDTNPWEPKIKGGLLYGLGAADMKAGLMASIAAYDLIKATGIRLKGKVLINSVVDEEGGGNGTLTSMLYGNQADGAVVCEPTGNKIIIAHMGFIFFEIKTTGLAVHSGSKWKGVSAIEKMIKIINGLNELEDNWKTQYYNPLLPPPNLNVGEIYGGTAGSTVANACSIKICLHYLPEVMTHDHVVGEVIKKIDAIADQDQWLKEHRPTWEIYQAGGAFQIAKDHPFVKTAFKTFQEVGETLLAGSPAGNDARLIHNIGKIPTIIAGPGNQEQCHAVNEYVSVDMYINYILKYAKLMLDFCGYKNF
ncbi:M20 family metallopeptidase [Clostridium formicaceticum]|uniref:Acetylornithine deacetylase n=1 Tax=Clostridium formicaceticum TaxID=1497 RepID=A0AAC9RL15_9CLOT|nr:ArgE/DapE family deacylase [Clostridium formicaceticum]AOY76560.1 acetylornithine deacetylase [Clostridium formicaceticum]ARE86978.1 N-formyl-4-amino-5-aminomethyl-2-methylpyrimidine deformylase [Clostridium formicaceticum]